MMILFNFLKGFFYSSIFFISCIDKICSGFADNISNMWMLA